MRDLFNFIKIELLFSLLERVLDLAHLPIPLLGFNAFSFDSLTEDKGFMKL
jgi:hypothetical protein